ncbi:hypothetical protein LCGC14_2426810 [marine sediment metagenome]|uniref:N-acetyltransferase domain-containing protein n=1 Tax=marine sediment metagenome TaxID=412755 RepID=A0A0F9E064_9ZZZZ
MKLRKVTKDDCWDLLRWENVPVTQKYTFNSKTISRKEHLKWFKKALKEIEMYIIGDKIGLVKIKNNSVAIIIDPAYRNQGYGIEALNLIKKKHPKLIAYVLFGNTNSYKLFKKAGFKKIGYILKNG